MTQEEKDLLIRDLCARLPFSVKLLVPSWDEREMEYVDRVDILYSVNGDGYIRTPSEDYDFDIEDVKPYLFPLESMTEEQKIEIKSLCDGTEIFDDGGWMSYISILGDFNFEINLAVVDWLNKNHFDYRGLIQMSLAIDATGLNIYQL